MQRRPRRARPAAAALAKLMTDAGLNNRETARLTGFDESTIGRWRNGKSVPDPRNAEHLAAKIGERFPDLAACAERFVDAVMHPVGLEVSFRLEELIIAVNCEIAAVPAEDRADLTEEVRQRIGQPSNYAAAGSAKSAE